MQTQSVEKMVKCFEYAIPSAQETFGSPSALQAIRYEMKTLPLLAGCYFINVQLYPTDSAYRYDFRWQMYPLQVEGNERISGSYTTGMVAIDAQWDIGTVQA